MNIDATAWYGRSRNRVWVRLEGGSDDGRVDDAEVHALVGRQFSRWWDMVGGIRQDVEPGPAQTWAAVGVQGLAPYWFEVELTGYLGASGRTQLRSEVEYELLLTNRLILQPRFEANLFGKSDPERGIGAGLESTDVGFRLRYEFKRELAPYVGVAWRNTWGETADLAEVIHDLAPKRRAEVAAALDDERLADVLEELPEDDQVQILATLERERAADVLEAMEPDDATDLLKELTPEQREELLGHMEPDEAAPLRRLLTYDENTAGGMMTTEPVILAPDATIAHALAVVRKVELSPALASTVFVCRPPLETPTGKFLGIVHIQRLLREPPHNPIGGILDKELEPLRPHSPLGQVTRVLATYNLTGVPIVDEEGRLVGAVTVDDVLDHILPDDWREERHEVTRD